MGSRVLFPHDVPISDNKGNPTPFFARQLKILLDEKQNVSDVADAAAATAGSAIQPSDLLNELLSSLGGDPAADKIVYWDDTTNTFKFLSLGSNLSISTSTLNAAGGGSGGGLKILKPHMLDPGTNGAGFSAGYVTLLPYLVEETCAIASISAYARAASTAKLEPVIYSNSPTTGLPTTRLMGGPQNASTVFGVNSLPLTSNLSVTAGDIIWYGVGASGASWTPCATYGMGGCYFAFTSPAPATVPTLAGGPGYGGSLFAYWMVTA